MDKRRTFGPRSAEIGIRLGAKLSVKIMVNTELSWGQCPPGPEAIRVSKQYCTDFTVQCQSGM